MTRCARVRAAGRARAVLQVLSTVVSGMVAGGVGGKVTLAGGLAISLTVNAVLFLAVFRLLTHGSVPFRELWPGIVSATVAWTRCRRSAGTTSPTCCATRARSTDVRDGDRPDRVACTSARASSSTRPRSTAC